MMKNKYLIYVSLVLEVIGIIFISGWIKQTIPTQASTSKTKPVDLFSGQTEKISFIKYYSLTPLDITLQVSQYNLPLKTNQIYNFGDFSTKISLSTDALSLLEKNGFVIINNPFNPKEEYITRPYKTLKDKKIPIFITSDSLLHLYHIQFDETLRQIEEREFYDKIWEISKQLLDDSIEEHNSAGGDLKEASRRNVAYFAVGLELLKPKEGQICKNEKHGKCFIDKYTTTDKLFMKEDAKKYAFATPDFVKDDVEKELKLIKNHRGFSKSPIFIYREDYSQYLPRGHYTRSEKLKNYFKAMMWYGRMSMLLKGSPNIPRGETRQDDPKGFISAYDAKIQTIGASLIALNFSKSKELRDKWNRIYSVTAFYVGFSDDLGPYEYIDALNYVFNGTFNLNNLTGENIGKLKAKLAEFRSPKIYGGTGDAVLLPPFTPKQANKILGNTKGFRLMGQRFIPDSYLLSRLVSPYVGRYTGKNCDKVFTCEITPIGPVRAFPRGLDVMALLGCERAREILMELSDTKYEDYETQFNKLKEKFDNFTDANWQKNLYWAWLYALKPLLKRYEEGYPTFMQTRAWQDKELTTSLASWTQLRHDTILYAKQSYTMVTSAIPYPQKQVVGYVEPVPYFYNRLLALTQMTNKGLDEMHVLDDTQRHRLKNLQGILEKLVNISSKELENKELTKKDYDFIKNFGTELNSVIANVDEKAKKTTVVADVHTDGNTHQVLEEGVGYVRLMLVAYKVPDGRILIGAGPVMSYYEFKYPMDDRLTDEKWRNLLASNPPKRPKWTYNFTEL